MSGNWIAVACAEHVSRGRQGGFMQVCHGKAGPLKRVLPGSRVAYYSPTTRMGGGDRCQSFTAIGTVADGELYQFDMGGGFRPFRRDVRWWTSEDAPIHPLLDQLAFTAAKGWGAKLRFGLLAISDTDMDTIARSMGASSVPVTQRA